jgi:hypothetical protein
MITTDLDGIISKGISVTINRTGGVIRNTGETYTLDTITVHSGGGILHDTPRGFITSDEGRSIVIIENSCPFHGIIEHGFSHTNDGKERVTVRYPYGGEPYYKLNIVATPYQNYEDMLVIIRILSR